MTKASDNAFPSILLEDHVDPAAPSDGFHRLFIDTDEKLKMIDHASLVTDFTPTAAGDITADAAWAAKGDLIVGTANNTAAILTAGTDGKVLTTASGEATGLKWDATPAASDAVSVASGAGSIIIPGLAASPDIRVAGASDDEFDSTDTSDPMTGWTTLGAPTAHNINSTAKSHYYVSKDATAGPAQHGIYKAISVPFTVTCKITDMTLNGNDNCAGVFVGEASPGKMLQTSLVYNSGVNTRRKVQCQKWTNPTTWSSTTAAIDGNFDVPIYLRMVVASSTDISAYYSVGGHVWRTIVVSNNPSFTVESVGLFMLQNNASYNMKAVFDWVRIS